MATVVVSQTQHQVGVEEVEYESDSDGASALALRRRAASDDDERGAVMDAASSADDDASRPRFSDDEGEGPGEGTPPLDEDDEEEEEEEEEEENDDGEAFLRRRRKGSDEEDDGEGEGDGLQQVEGSDESGLLRKSGEQPEGAEESLAPATTDGKETNDEEKKEAEPFVVPTAGAFYMHDDRFRENGGARPRRSMGGRKLWESKDEKLWVHDLFDELITRDESFSTERGGRGRSRGRERGRDRGRGWVGKLASDLEELAINRARRGRGRGHGSRAEVADSTRTEQATPASNSYSSKGAQDSPGSSSIEAHSKQNEVPPPKKVSTGSLSSASPPFFPSGTLQQKFPEGSDNKHANLSQNSKGRERDAASGARDFTPQGTTPVTSVSVAKPAGSTGRGVGVSGAEDHGLLQSNIQQPDVRSTPLQRKVPLSSTGVAHIGRSGGSQTQFVLPPQHQAQLQPPQAQQPQTSGPNMRSAQWSTSENTAQPARHKGSGGRGGRGGNYQVVGGRRSSYTYHGGPAAGLRSGVHIVDPGFTAPMPNVGPVAVQYGGQPQTGMGVPAVGMAMPNYSGQPQYGFANQEVAWVPVLGGGTAIGAGYAAPYMTMDATPAAMYYTQPVTQPASFQPPGRGELNGSKPSGLWKPPPRPEHGADEFGQRQSKPRRYSEMSFGQ